MQYMLRLKFDLPAFASVETLQIVGCFNRFSAPGCIHK